MLAVTFDRGGVLLLFAKHWVDPLAYAESFLLLLSLPIVMGLVDRAGNEPNGARVSIGMTWLVECSTWELVHLPYFRTALCGFDVGH